MSVTTEQAGRSAEVGWALQRVVARDPDLASSIVGVGVDALSSMLINQPDEIPRMAGWIELINGIRAYVMEGDATDTIADLLAGTLPITVV